MTHPQPQTPDYLVLGHISKDLLADGRVALGGTATYSALTAQKLGLQAAVVTACAEEDVPLLAPLIDAGVWVHALPSPATTTFENIYDAEGNRTQYLRAHANILDLQDVPKTWRAARIVHLGPVAQELPAAITTSFQCMLLGVTPQGWMRSWDRHGRVTHSAYPVPPALANLPATACLVLSIEDLGHDETMLRHYVNLAPFVAITRGAGAALLKHGDTHHHVPAYPATPTDPTGAGDVFATALFVRYTETHDPVESTRFAHAAAACAIEGEGIASIPGREAVELKRKT